MYFFGELNTFVSIFICILLFYNSQHRKVLKLFHSKQARAGKNEFQAFEF